MNSSLQILALKIAICIFSILCGLKTNAQETSNNTDIKRNLKWFNFIQVTGYKGQHLTERKLMSTFQEPGYGAGIRFGKQSIGTKAWQRLHAYPSYGIGLSFFDLGNSNIESMIGSPNSAYLFFGMPVYRYKKLQLDADLEFGLSYNFNPYDDQTNLDNIFIASKVNLHFNLSVQLYYALCQRIDVGFGFSFIHFSNGKTCSPQKGINLYGFNINARYNHCAYKKEAEQTFKPAYSRPDFIYKPFSPFKRSHEISLMASVGTVQASPGEWRHKSGELDSTAVKGPRYYTNSVIIDYNYQFSKKMKATAGFDVFYDGAAEHIYTHIPPEDITMGDKVFYGAHAGLIYLIGNFRVNLSYGRYIYKPFERRGSWYLRVGSRFKIYKGLDANLSLKTRSGLVADWIEWGLAYNFKLKNID